MHIEINDHTTIRSIQKIFSNFYPYLKIIFLKKPKAKNNFSDESNLIFEGKTIGEVKHTHLSSVIEILPLSKLSDIEDEFYKRLGLSVQILVNQKNKWEQTTGMNHFTIKELNELGRSSFDEYILSEPDSEYSDEN
jgi:hypothetical protein